jgi:alpha-amylase/alpha-mannosidase (GH57 family)
MNKKLPKLYTNKLFKKFKNNNTVFYSAIAKKPPKIKKIESQKNNNNIDINQKIKNMLDSPKYIYKIKAIITTKDNKILEKEIIGKIEDNLITINDEYISINTIQDITY